MPPHHPGYLPFVGADVLIGPPDPIAKLNVRKIFRLRASDFLYRQKVTKELPKERGISISPFP